MYELIIIGGGIAGISAAVYAQRAGLACMLLEAANLGGQLSYIDTVENYPGFVRVSGYDLAQSLSAQIDHLRIPVAYKKVNGITYTDAAFRVQTEREEFFSRTIIVATGAIPQKLGLNREEFYEGKGISYCAVCDGFFFKNKTVAVVGGGNTALEEALYLSSLAKKVYLVHRRDRFRGFPSLADKVKDFPAIEILFNSVVTAYQGETRLERVTLKDAVTGETRTVTVDGLFVAIGYAPKTDAVPASIQKDETGFIITDESYATSCPGAFACGDCRKRQVRQLVTAASEGAQAALSAYEYIKNTQT